MASRVYRQGKVVGEGQSVERMAWTEIGRDPQHDRHGMRKRKTKNRKRKSRAHQRGVGSKEIALMAERVYEQLWGLGKEATAWKGSRGSSGQLRGEKC